MEKIIWITSTCNALGEKMDDGLQEVDKHSFGHLLNHSLQGERKMDDGLQEVNKCLEDGWRVKMISATPDRKYGLAHAYVVLEK